MFVRATLLTHVPGATLDQMRLESQEDLKTLEAALAEFVNDPLCPKLVAEEFLESQEEEEKPAGI